MTRSTWRRVQRSLCSAVLIWAILGPALPAEAVWRPRQVLLELVNERRRPDLVDDWRLDELARRHSVHMRDQGRIFHSGYRPCWYFGENVGSVTGGAPYRLRDLIVAMMWSPPHRANIVDTKFRRVGIGVTARDGIVYVTLMFCA